MPHLHKALPVVGNPVGHFIKFRRHKMAIIKVNTNDRFSSDGFPQSNERFFVTQKPVNSNVYEQVVYKCEKCENEIEFFEKNFKEHSHSQFTNLIDKDKQIIDCFIKENSLIGYSFLDFYCPKCNRPISVFYKDGYGGQRCC